MRLGCLIVCTRGSALLPSRLPPSRALAPPSPLAPAARAGEPGTLRGGRGAGADSRAGRPPRAARSGKLGRTAAAVCRAPQSEWRLLRSRPRAGGGGGEKRRAPFAPRSALLTFGEAERPAPGPGAGEAWGGGEPHRGTRPPTSAVPGCSGEFVGCPFQIWGGLSRYGSSVLPRLRLVTRGSGTPRPPGAAPRPERGLGRPLWEAETT